MRNNTQKIYDRLVKGEFLSVDSTDPSIRHLYQDIEDNFDDYSDYFREIGLQLEACNGCYYFSRIGESKVSIEQKLDSFSKWLDYMDFLKCYNHSFSAGYQFRKSQLIEQISCDIELQDKAGRLFKKYNAESYQDVVDKLLLEMESWGFAECISPQDETYKVTSAFTYAEELVSLINNSNEDEVSQ